MDKPVIVYDTEVYPNMFMFKGRVLHNRNLITIRDDTPEARILLRETLAAPCTFVSFNGIKFDVPVMSAFLAGKSSEEVKRIANAIIEQELQPWDVERRFGFKCIDFDPPGLLEQDGRLRTNLSGNGITGDWKTVRKSGVQQPIKVTVVNPGGGSFILDDAFMVRSLSSSQLGTIRAVWQWLFTIIAVVLLLDVIIPGLTKFQNITVWPPILGCIGFALISAAVKQSRREGPTTTLTIFGCSFIAMSILAIWLSSVGGN
jgi:hypothetical protein